MKPKWISITPAGKAGMSRQQIDEVVATLRGARKADKIPLLSFEYNPHPRAFGADPLYLQLKTKGAGIARTGVKVRTVIRDKFGSKYSVKLV